MDKRKEFIHTKDELRVMQALPLNIKIAMTKTRIRQFLQAFDAHISFSGGKDSTVLLDIARQIDADIPAVFFDTGMEYPEIREFVKTIPNVEWVKPEKTFRQVIREYGYPVIGKEVASCIYYARKGSEWAKKRLTEETPYNKTHYINHKNLLDAPFLVSDKCCWVMKKHPADLYERQSKQAPMLGTLAEESSLRINAWLKTGCNSFDSKRPMSRPLSFWTEQDVLLYLKTYNVPYCPVYGEIIEDENGRLATTGEKRTGCMFCMFGAAHEKSPNKFERMKIGHPAQWAFCMKPVDEGGLGLKEVLAYIGVKSGCEEVNNGD